MDEPSVDLPQQPEAAPAVTPPDLTDLAFVEKELARLAECKTALEKERDLWKVSSGLYQRDLNNTIERLSAVDADRDEWRRAAGRARTEASDARNLQGRFIRAMRDVRDELVEAGIEVPSPGLEADPGVLWKLIRRLARDVQEIGPQRDELRKQVTNLQKDALNRQREINDRDARISALEAEVRTAKHQAKLFESSTEAMQRARDASQVERDSAKKDLTQAKAENEHKFKLMMGLRALVKELEAKLGTTHEAATPGNQDGADQPAQAVGEKPA